MGQSCEHSAKTLFALSCNSVLVLSDVPSLLHDSTRILLKLSRSELKSVSVFQSYFYVYISSCLSRDARTTLDLTRTNVSHQTIYQVHFAGTSLDQLFLRTAFFLCVIDSGRCCKHSLQILSILVSHRCCSVLTAHT